MKIKKRITTHEEIEIEVSFPVYLRLKDTGFCVAFLSESTLISAHPTLEGGSINTRLGNPVNYLESDDYELISTQEFITALSEAYSKITKVISPILSINQ